MTTVDPADWLDRLGQDIAQADANSLHAVRTSLAGVAGNDPDTAVASVVLQLRDVRKHLTAPFPVHAVVYEGSRVPISVVGNVPLTRTVFVLWTGACPPPTSGVCDLLFLVIVSRWIAKKWSVVGTKQL